MVPSFRDVSIAIALLIGLAVSSEAGAAQQSNGDSFKVLFIGNSHLFVNNVPSRVQRLLAPTKGNTRIKTFATGGAQLSGYVRRGDVVSALRNTAWDVVVLQEASAVFFTKAGRKRFRKSLEWFRRNVPESARIVLYQTWPWQEGSRYFQGRPLNPTQMWRAMREAYDQVEKSSGMIIAPVGICWLSAPRPDAFYSSDGIHASLAGSRLAASVISRTIKGGARVKC